MKNYTITTITTLSIAATGLCVFSEVASAAALKGEFQIGSFSTLIDMSLNKIDFKSGSSDPQEVLITSQTNSFTAFNSAFIKDIAPIPGDGSPLVANFLDLEVPSPPSGLKPGDGKNTFSITQISDYDIEQNGSNVGISVFFDGFFTSADNELTDGSGNLTFQANNTTVAALQTLLNNGGTVSGLTFSGGVFTVDPGPGGGGTTPEASNLVGLLALGLIGGAAILRKQPQG